MKRCVVLLMLASLLAMIPIVGLAKEQPVSSIQFNEVFAFCSGRVLQDESGNSPDWIEIHNTGEAAVSLKGFCLSDGITRLDKFVFPDAIIPAGGYQIVFCSGEDRIIETEMHTSFKLSGDGETLVLSYQGQVLDAVDTGRQVQDVPLARNDTGMWEKTQNYAGE